MSARWIAASVFVAFSGATLAQSPAVLGRSDAAFANALVRGGYTDLAEKLCQLLESKGNLDAEENAGVRALRLDLRLDLALREPDLIKRKDLIAQILAEKEDLARQFAGRKVGDETSATLPEVYQKLGETISRAIQNSKDKDPAQIGQLQKEGADIFKAAEEKLEARIKDLQEALSDSSASNPKLEDQLIAARYNLPRTRYFHALLFGKADTLSRDALLDQAVQGFQEFSLDYGDTLFAYEGLVYEGLCYKEKENWKDAFQAFDDAIKLREGYDLDAKGYYPMGPYEADLVSWAVLQKMTLLIERGDLKAAIEEGKTFFDTTPAADETRHGLAILAAKADAHQKAGDVKGAAECADKLVELDPRGPWGAAGREIQGRMLASGGPLDPEKVLRIAQTYLERGDTEQALRVAHRAIDAIGRDQKQASVGIDAWMMIASIYMRRDGNWDHEVALAFDSAADAFGGNEKAADAVLQSMKTYLRLAKAEKKPFYKKRAEDRQKTLISKYPSTRAAGEAALFEADGLAAENKYVEAADLYGRVQPGASMYLEAQFKAGECYFFHARELLSQEAKKAEGKTFAGQAETLMKKAMVEADKQREKTLDLAQKASLDNLGLRARSRLARLYLTEGVDKPADVIPLLEGADERYSGNPEAVAQIWQDRISALQRLGRLDEAITMLDALVRKDPESRGVGPAAGELARALDRRSAELREKEKKPREAEEMLRKAANYYAMEGRALLKAENPKVRTIETTANRLYAIGLISNEVPESQSLFVGWDPKKVRDASQWQLSSDLLEAALRIQPGYAMQITLGRVYGFLGQYDRAATVLGALFDQEKIYDDKKNQLNRKVLQGKPELLGAYFEWGVAEHLVAVKDQDTDRFRRAQQILSAMTKNLDANSRNWWYAKYYEIRNAADAGDYENARFLLNDTERTTTGFGKEFGLEPLFVALKDELKK
jgi:hypothetical protein